MMSALLSLSLWVCLVVTAENDPTVHAIEIDRSELTLERIFDSGEFQPQDVAIRWTSTGGSYEVLEGTRDGGQELVEYTVSTGERKVLVASPLLTPPGADRPLKVEDWQWSPDRSMLLLFTDGQRVWREKTRGNYWLLDRTSRTLRKLGGDVQTPSLMFAKFSPTSRHVAYVFDRDIWLEDLRDGSIRQLTNRDSEDVINGTFDWVYEEELALQDGFRWSPDGQSIAYWQLDTRGVPRFPLVNNTDSFYPRVTEIAYPKVGETNSACRIGVLALTGSDTIWLDVPGDARDNYLARMEWARPNELIVQQLNRRQNTLRVLLADATTGGVTTLLEEKDETWIDIHDELRWLSDGQTFTWVSERDGWRHVYLGTRDNPALRLITPGEYDVIELLSVDEKSQCIYFAASPDNACQKYLYRVQLDGTGLQRVTPNGLSGTFSYQVSPDQQSAVMTESAFDRIPTTSLVSLPAHEVVRVLEDNRAVRENLAELKRPQLEFLRVDIGDGVQLDGWCIRPADLDPNKKYPLLVHVYGEPAGQTVVDRWGGANALWHWMLAQRGYVVMSFDNRGTPAPRGRAWRKSIYHQIGILAAQDQAAAVTAVLRDRPYLDSGRVGVWGWSGGGSMSLHALFKYPELYHTAISIAPVANERYYDTIYQERYMGLPGDNPEGYTQGSAVNFAHQLQGNLLLIHGTGDDNCHYQTTEMLINELIRLDKPFTMMAYPNRSHSIREGANTTLHLRRLMTRYLDEKLLPVEAKRGVPAP
jgi:dipeptidyl-peptidase-4